MLLATLRMWAQFAGSPAFKVSFSKMADLLVPS
jgi:hypothetical protein